MSTSARLPAGPDLVVVPTARLVLPELQADVGPLPPALLPLRGRTALELLVERYPDAELVVATGEAHGLVAEAVERLGCPRVRVVEVGATGSLAETVTRALAASGALADRRLVVHFPDTWCEVELDRPVVVATAGAPAGPGALRRWTTIEVTEAGIAEVVDKDATSLPSPDSRVVTGVFALGDAAQFAQALAACAEGRAAGTDPFHLAVMATFNAAPPAGRRVAEAMEWHDLGHLDGYHQARAARFLDARSFNRVEVDLARGRVRKTSSDEGKLAAEAGWYRGLPAELAHLAPRVFGAGPGWVELEYYGYPALDAAFLHGAWDLADWDAVLRSLALTVADLQAHPAPAPGPGAATPEATATAAARWDCYVEKTRRRCAGLGRDPRFAAWGGAEAVVNGVTVPGLATVLAELPAVLGAAGLLGPGRFTVVHGDLCLSNLLYDRRTGIVRLIDPRGSFGTTGIYGDPAYDLAKLAHSLRGGYELLLHGQADVGAEAGDLRVCLRPSARQREVRELAAGWLGDLAARAGIDPAAVALVEAVLFLSMVPLHADRPRAQLAFFGRGLELWARARDGVCCSSPRATGSTLEPGLRAPQDPPTLPGPRSAPEGAAASLGGGRR